jgi:hypothetical protein
MNASPERRFVCVPSRCMGDGSQSFKSFDFTRVQYQVDWCIWSVMLNGFLFCGRSVAFRVDLGECDARVKIDLSFEPDLPVMSSTFWHTGP